MAYLQGLSRDEIAIAENMPHTRVSQMIEEILDYLPDSVPLRVYREIAKFAFKKGLTSREIVEAIHTKSWLDAFGVSGAMLYVLKQVYLVIDIESISRGVKPLDVFLDLNHIVEHYYNVMSTDGGRPPLGRLPDWIDGMMHEATRLRRELAKLRKKISSKIDELASLSYVVVILKEKKAKFGADIANAAKALKLIQDSIIATEQRLTGELHDIVYQKYQRRFDQDSVLWALGKCMELRLKGISIGKAHASGLITDEEVEKMYNLHGTLVQELCEIDKRFERAEMAGIQQDYGMRFFGSLPRRKN